MKFVGDYPAKTDSKGRVFLPAPLRKALEEEGVDQFVLRNDLFQPCLVLYPASVWDALTDNLKSKMNPFNRNHKMLMRQFALDAEPVELDRSGRLLISKRKLEFAGIESDVRFLAVDDYIEVWSPSRLQEVMSQEEELGTNIENIFGNG